MNETIACFLWMRYDFAHLLLVGVNVYAYMRGREGRRDVCTGDTCAFVDEARGPINVMQNVARTDQSITTLERERTLTMANTYSCMNGILLDKGGEPRQRWTMNDEERRPNGSACQYGIPSIGSGISSNGSGANSVILVDCLLYRKK